MKGGSSLERLANVNAFAFDKTGTLTFGQPDLVDIVIMKKTKQEILSIAAGLEYTSNHPYAKVIIDVTKKEKAEIFEIEKLKVIPGYGIQGGKNNKKYYIGSLYDNYQAKNDEVISQIDKFKDQGYSNCHSAQYHSGYLKKAP